MDEALVKGWEVWAGIRKSSSKTYLNHPDLHFIDLDYADSDALLHQLEKANYWLNSLFNHYLISPMSFCDQPVFMVQGNAITMSC